MEDSLKPHTPAGKLLAFIQRTVHPTQRYLHTHIAGKWNQSRCPSTGKWVIKTQYRYTMEFYPVVKKHEIAGKLIDLGNI